MQHEPLHFTSSPIYCLASQLLCSWRLHCSTGGGDHTPLHLVHAAGLHHRSGAFDGRLHTAPLEVERRGGVHHKSGARASLDQRVFVAEIRFHQLQPSKELAEAELQRLQLLLVAGASHRAAHGEGAVLQESQAGRRAQVARDSGDDHHRLLHGRRKRTKRRRISRTKADTCCINERNLDPQTTLTRLE